MNMLKTKNELHIKNNKLHLQANDPAIAQELEWRESQILEAIKPHINEDKIQALKVTIKKV